MTTFEQVQSLTRPGLLAGASTSITISGQTEDLFIEPHEGVYTFLSVRSKAERLASTRPDRRLMLNLLEVEEIAAALIDEARRMRANGAT